MGPHGQKIEYQSCQVVLQTPNRVCLATPSHAPGPRLNRSAYKWPVTHLHVVPGYLYARHCTSRAAQRTRRLEHMHALVLSPIACATGARYRRRHACPPRLRLARRPVGTRTVHTSAHLTHGWSAAPAPIPAHPPARDPGSLHELFQLVPCTLF